MLALTLVVALNAPASSPAAPSWYGTGRVYSSRALHVGVRGAAFVSPDEIAVGASVQVSTRWF